MRTVKAVLNPARPAEWERANYQGKGDLTRGRGVGNGLGWAVDTRQHSLASA